MAGMKQASSLAGQAFFENLVHAPSQMYLPDRGLSAKNATELFAELFAGMLPRPYNRPWRQLEQLGNLAIMPAGILRELQRGFCLETSAQSASVNLNNRLLQLWL